MYSSVGAGVDMVRRVLFPEVGSKPNPHKQTPSDVLVFCLVSHFSVSIILSCFVFFFSHSILKSGGGYLDFRNVPGH